MIFRELRADEIECRIGTINAKGLSLLLYKDARCDMRVLDETVGALNWQKSYSRDNANCTVSIWDDAKLQWISKEDTGTENYTEREKSIASDSFKRACFCWGIGRALYTSPFIWIPVSACNIQVRGEKYVCFDKFTVAEIEYDDGRIVKLTITKDGEPVYKFDDKRQNGIERSAIGVRKAAALRKYIEGEGIPELYIRELYKVPGLAELSEKQHRNIFDNIAKLKEGAAAWKQKGE